METKFRRFQWLLKKVYIFLKKQRFLTKQKKWMGDRKKIQMKNKQQIEKSYIWTFLEEI